MIVDLEAEAVLNEVFLVGPSKPLGMLSEDILEECNSSPKEVMEWAYRQNLKSSFWVYDIDMKEVRLLVVWDGLLLGEILALNKEMLNADGWPVETTKFLSRLVWEVSNRNSLPSHIVGSLQSDSFEGSRRMILPPKYVPHVRGFRDRLWNGSEKEHTLRCLLS